jgi:hypothetical protein
VNSTSQSISKNKKREGKSTIVKFTHFYLLDRLYSTASHSRLQEIPLKNLPINNTFGKTFGLSNPFHWRYQRHKQNEQKKRKKKPYDQSNLPAHAQAHRYNCINKIKENLLPKSFEKIQLNSCKSIVVTKS